MPIPEIFAVMGRWLGGDGTKGDRYIRRVEYVGEVGETDELRAYASTVTASRVTGDDFDCIYRIAPDGKVTLHEEETARFRRGEKLLPWSPPKEKL